jgi:hypothetical protein
VRRTTALTFLLWLSAGGCGSNLAPDPTIVPLASWASEVAAVQCAAIFRCCDSAEIQYWGYADEADCRRKVADQESDVAQTVRQGLIVYDSKAARRCLDEFDALSCAVAFGHADPRIAPSCADVTRGAGKLGAPCEDLDLACESANCLPSSGLCGPQRACPAACDAGQYCAEAAGGCTAAKPDGAACSLSLECTSPSICYAGACGPKQSDGTVCLADDNCLSGACVHALDGSGACGAPYPDGSACYSDSACTSGTCAKRTATGGATCGPLFCDGV